MKKIVLGMMLAISSLSFSSDKESTLKVSNIFENFKEEKSQDQLDTKNKLKISNIFSNKK
ncbi:hypothetical protein NRK67_16990 (plasmid) [Fusobacteria bacterium ZRK30]|nr:hypothetical protein NRK67_16990 [Fusobacteria bacterium ZRK30]